MQKDEYSFQGNSHKQSQKQRNHVQISKSKQQKSQGTFANVIVEMMKKTKKNSPLFKPIKKLKTSIQAIGGQKEVSFYEPTNKLVVFHFGLGNQIDNQIILNGTTLKKQSQEGKLEKDFVILPGKAFTFISFQQTQTAKSFLAQNEFKNIFFELDNQKMEQKQKEKDKQKQKQVSKVESLQPEQINQKRPLFYFKQIQHKNLQRLTIFFYLKSQDSHNQQQQTLIDIPNCPSKYGQDNYIQGLHLLQDFVSQEQELRLLQWIDSQPWQKLSNRRVQHYGFQFKYGRNQVDKDQQYHHKMPQVFQFLLKRLSNLVNQLSGEHVEYDQLTINDYFAGHGIPAHFDTHSPFEEYFVAISMLSGIVMDWKRYDGAEKSTYLKQRSTVVFSGEARYAWLHSIACRKLDNIDNQLRHRSRRLSLTFRKIKRTPCECKFYFFCDSQGYDQHTMKKNNPLLKKYLCEQNEKKLKKLSHQTIYSEFVLKAYNSFGYDFHNKVIPQIKEYLGLESQKLQNSLNQSLKFVIDIGCGNGEYKKYLNSDKFYYFGVQRCQVMIPVEEEAHMDALRLGFKEQSFDIILLVAVLHHFPTEKERIQCLIQGKRVLSKNGCFYLTVFNFEQKKNEYPTQDILLDYCLSTHKTLSTEGISPNQFNNQPHPVFPQNLPRQSGKKTQNGQIFTRYYHLFKIKQLQHIIKQSGLKIQEMKSSKDNIIVKLTKI